jgi:hypothetical protein
MKEMLMATQTEGLRRVTLLQNSHPMSGLRVLVLVLLCVFFCSLFLGAYVWMRRPGFGQGGGKEAPKATRTDRGA